MTTPVQTPVFDSLPPEGQRNAEYLFLAAINEGQHYKTHCAAARQELECWGQSPAFRRVIALLVRQGLRNADDSRPTLPEQHAAAELTRRYYRQHLLETGTTA